MENIHPSAACNREGKATAYKGNIFIIHASIPDNKDYFSTSMDHVGLERQMISQGRTILSTLASTSGRGKYKGLDEFVFMGV